MSIVTILGLGIQVSIFLTVLSLGMQASLNDLAHLFRRSRLLGRAVISMYIIMPAFAVLMVKLLNLNHTVSVVLIALSVSPVPPLFPVKALKSGGEAAFIFGLLSALTLLSVIVIPLFFAIIETVFAVEIQFSISWLVKMIITGLLLAMAAGMTLKHFAPAFSNHFAAGIGKAGVILLLLCILPIAVFTLPEMWALIGNYTILVFILFALAGAGAGYFLGGPDAKERTVLALATTSRHLGIAFMIASANLGTTPKKMVLAALLLYLVISAIVTALFLKRFSGNKKTAKQPL